MIGISEKENILTENYDIELIGSSSFTPERNRFPSTSD
jgi:hypothetical protein